MEKVNELLQNIRFLKFFGWGIFSCVPSATSADSSPEYHWSDTANVARETELGWRVKENIVSTIIAFIWYVLCARSGSRFDLDAGPGYRPARP
jgi:hypothetical protein